MLNWFNFWRKEKRKLGAEAKLWNELKYCRFHNLNFVRNYWIGKKRVSFYCSEKRLSIVVYETDHDCSDKCLDHLRKDEDFSSHGIKVLRFSENDILKNLEKVLSEISRRCGFENEEDHFYNY